MLRNADVFIKPRHDLRSKSAVGGIITLVASTAAAILFVAQLYLYVVGSARHSLHLSESKSIPMLPGHHASADPFINRMFELHGKMSLKIHVTFPHITCDKLEVHLDGAALTPGDFDAKRNPKGKKVEMRQPTPTEINVAVGNKSQRGGCTVRTVLRVPIVAGHVSVSISRRAWTEATTALLMQSRDFSGNDGDFALGNKYNVSHYIHSIQFGTPFPEKIVDNPLEDRAHMINNQMGGIALENIQVKLVPTLYQSGWLSSLSAPKTYYQASVVDHTVQPEALVSHGVPSLPGLSLSYDITPLAVHHDNGRDNFLVFLSSLFSIVGGVFVTVGLLTGCLVHSASAVAKKVD